MLKQERNRSRERERERERKREREEQRPRKKEKDKDASRNRAVCQQYNMQTVVGGVSWMRSATAALHYQQQYLACITREQRLHGAS